MGLEIGPWTDLYSVGVMAHEQIVGRAPFQETEPPIVILMRHVNERLGFRATKIDTTSTLNLSSI